MDLIDSCKSATEFILKLKWPDEYENARYLTGLSKVCLPPTDHENDKLTRPGQTIAKSIEQYSAQLEGLFLAEMFPRQEEDSVDQDVARPSAWLTKAKLAVQGDKKVQPFVFQSQVGHVSLALPSSSPTDRLECHSELCEAEQHSSGSESARHDVYYS